MVAQKLTYVEQQLSRAINLMATTDIALRKRIDYAHKSFQPLEPRHFDGFPEIQEQFVELMDRLTLYGDEAGEEGTVPKSIRLSTDDEIEEIADLIFDIFDSVCHS